MSAKKGRALRISALALGVLVAVLLAAQGELTGEVYRYVDEQGNIHVTDTPPGEGEARGLKVYRGRSYAPEAPKKAKTAGVYAIPFRSIRSSLRAVQGMEVEATLTRGYTSITRRFVVDTGASATVITLDDARELGVSEGDVAGSSVGVVPGGGRILAHHVPLDSIRLGDLEIYRPVVAVIKGGGMRLLGIDVLGRFDLEVKHDREIIILKVK